MKTFILMILLALPFQVALAKKIDCHGTIFLIGVREEALEPFGLYKATWDSALYMLKPEVYETYDRKKSVTMALYQYEPIQDTKRADKIVHKVTRVGRSENNMAKEALSILLKTVCEGL